MKVYFGIKDLINSEDVDIFMPTWSSPSQPIIPVTADGLVFAMGGSEKQNDDTFSLSTFQSAHPSTAGTMEATTARVSLQDALNVKGFKLSKTVRAMQPCSDLSNHACTVHRMHS